MKKFVRKRKTFKEGGTQTREGELYILDPAGGPADQEGGGLVRQLPSQLISRLRTDLQFAATINKGTAKANGKLKEEMAVVTRDAYVSKGVARKRLGQVIEQKIARGRESIHFFKHNLAKQKVASLKAAQVRVHEENINLKTRVERRNHELHVQKNALEAMGEISTFDEIQIRQKDSEIDDLKDFIKKLSRDLQYQKQKTQMVEDEKKDTQDQLYRAYSTLGRLAVKSGKASDKALVYELNDKEDVQETQGYIMDVSENEEEKDEEKRIEHQEKDDQQQYHQTHQSNVLLTPETKRDGFSRLEEVLRLRPKSAQPNRRSRSCSSSKNVAFETLPKSMPPTSSSSKKRSLIRKRPSSAHQSRSSLFSFSSPTSKSSSTASTSTTSSKCTNSSPTPKKTKRKFKKLHPYLERGRTYGPGWKSPVASTISSPIFSQTPISHQNTSILPKNKFIDKRNVTLHRKNGKRILKIRSGFNDCYSDEHVAALLSNTLELPDELKPQTFWPPTPEKGWQLMLKEENDRLNSIHKNERKHRYLRWYPSVGRGQKTPATPDDSPLRAMAEEDFGPSDPRKIQYYKPKRRSSIDLMGDWLEKSRDRNVEIEGTGMTGEIEDGIQEGPNLKRHDYGIKKHLREGTLPPKNIKEIKELQNQEKEEIPTLYAVTSKHIDYPNVNKLNLFKFDEETGKYIHTHTNMPLSNAAIERKRRHDELMNKNKIIPKNIIQEEKNVVSMNPKIKRKKKKKRPKSAKLSRKQSDELLNRLMNTTGSKFAGPGYRKGNRHVVRTSGSAKYQMEKMRNKIKKKEQEEANDTN